MEHTQSSTSVIEVAACTAAAAHRRDHQHAVRGESCHPHSVEVIHLGNQAFAVCHDCGADSGLLPHRDAAHLAAHHRDQTRVTSVRLCPIDAGSNLVAAR